MATSQIVPFATGVGANVVDLATYTGSSTRSAGFQTGPALSAYVNRALRQSALMSAAVSQYIATIGNVDSLDNGDVTAQVNGLIAAVSASSAASLAWSNTRAYAIGDLAQRNGELYMAVVANTGSAPPSFNWRPIGNGLTTVNVGGAANVTLSESVVANRIIYLTGALTGNIQVTFPAAVLRFWIVYNLTTGPFSLTVKGDGSPPGSIVVPQGYLGMAYSDGGGLYAAGSGFVDPLGASLNTGASVFSGPFSYTGPTPALFVGRNSNISGSGSGSAALSVFNSTASSSTSAAMLRLARDGLFAANLGIDTDNKLKWGGESLGANAYELWHALNAPASLSAGSGYQVLPSGFIIQGALTTTAITGEGSYTVTFPIAFPTAVIAVVPIIRNTIAADGVNCWAQYVSATTTTATFYAQRSDSGGTDPNGFTYLAIGY